MKKRRRFLPLVTLLLCTALLMTLPITAMAADVPNFENFTYANFFSAAYSVASTTGSATVSESTFTISATGVDASGSGCNAVAAKPSTTTLTLTAKESVSMTCTVDSMVTMSVPASVTTNSDGSKTFLLPEGKAVSFAVTASNGTAVNGSVGFTNVEPAESKVPSDSAAYTVNGSYFDYLDKAIEAAESSSATIIVSKSGKVYHSSYENDTAGYSDKEITFTIPSNVKLLLPYSESNASAGGNFDEKPNMSGTSKFYYNTQSAYSELQVPANTTINCEGQICVDSQVFADTLYSGCPGGPHGRIVLESKSALNIKNGGYLYCYGYITGVWNSTTKTFSTGSVTAEDGSTVYESFQALGWRGGNLMKKWMNSSSSKSFAFSDYALQNIESDFQINNGATLNFVTSLEGSGSNAQVPGTFISNTAGLMQLGDNGSVLRTYDPHNNRIRYTLSGNINVANLEMKLASLGSIDTQKYIMGLNHSMDFVVNSGANVNLLYSYKLMPGATITINKGGTVTVNSNVYIYDTADYVIDGLTYAHHQSYTWLKSVPVSYISATGYKSDGFGQVWNQGISQINASTPSGKVVVNGELIVASGGAVYTSSNGGQNVNKVITGTGKFINNSTVAQSIVADALDEAKTIYNNALSQSVEDHNKVVTPVVGLIAGKSEDANDYRSFGTGTYHGTESGYWYQYVVSVDSAESAELITGVSHPYSGTESGMENVIGVIDSSTAINYNDSNVATSLGTADSFTFTAKDMDVAVSGSNATATLGENWTYTLTGVNANTTLTLTTHEHKYESSVTDPTCTEVGYTTYTCICDVSYTADEVDALGHTWTAATCLAPKTCSVCGATEGEALGHSFTNYVSNNNATCQKNCTETAKCDRCDVTDEREVANTIIGHKYTTYSSNNDATCMADGTKSAFCDFGCGSEDKVTDAESKLAHVYTTYTSNADATCQKDGTKTASCDYNCGTKDTVTDEGSQTDHKYTTYTYNNDASCTKAGTKTASCDYNCGTENTVEDAEHPMLSHSFTNYVSNEDATCTADGTKTAECDNCDATDTIADTDSKLGHSFTSYEPNNDAVCGVDGTKTATCDRCDATDTVKDDGSALEHVFGEYVKATEATCFNNATETATCTRENCNQTDTREIADTKLEHVFTTYTSNEDATCTTDGTKTALCEHGCKTENTVKDEGSALGHSFTNYVSNGNATCTADGTETAKCNRCDATDTRTDADSKLDHSYGEYVSDGNATCTSDGTKTASCDYGCGTTDIVTDEGSKLDHSFTDYVSDNNAACVQSATETAKCDNCDATDTRVVEGTALDHSFTNYVSDGNATCVLDGTKTAKCERCDVPHTVADTGSATGHSYGEVAFEWTDDGLSATASITCDKCADGTKGKTLSGTVASEAAESSGGNCQQNAYTLYKATVELNGTSYTDTKKVEGDLGTHSMKQIGAKPATCTEDGNNAYYVCETCENAYVDENGEQSTTAEAQKLVSQGHDEVAHEAKAATCTEVGWDAYVTCSRCDYTTYEEKDALGHDYEDHAGQNATCTEIGWEDYQTCTRCDYTSYKEIPATGEHNYKNGVCTECGEKDPSGEDSGETELTGSILLQSASLNLLDKVSIIYKCTDGAISTDPEAVKERGVMLFDSAEKAATKDPAQAFEIVKLEYSDYDKKYIGQTAGIVAADMGKSQFAVAYLKMADDTYIYAFYNDALQIVEYSPLKYCKNKMNSTKEGAMCRAMMHYGAAAQIALRDMTSGLMNEGFAEIPYDEAVLGNSVFYANTDILVGLQINAVSMSFEGAISYNVKYTVKDTSISEKQMYVEYTLLETIKSVEMELGTDGRMWATISGIPAQYLDDTLTVRPYYLDDEGEKVYGAELVYSGYEYARNVIKSGKQTESAKNLAKALAMYIYYVDAYFNS